MIPSDVHKIIRYLEERVDQLNENARVFVSQMAAKLDQHGDAFFCSWKQRKYLSGLYGRIARTEPEQPKSRLDELRERKSKLGAEAGRQRQREKQAASQLAGGAHLVIRDIAAGPVTARMRRDKNLRRQMKKNPMLVKDTKRD